jgi:WD40 repeat protein
VRFEWDFACYGLRLIWFCRVSAISGVAWVPSAPGSFVSFTQRNGIIRLWNVSQKSVVAWLLGYSFCAHSTFVSMSGRHPLESIRVCSTGFVSVSFINNTPRALCACHDGSVLVYDLTTRTTLFKTPAAHTETIFDVKYKHSDRRVLATASYDAAVKVYTLAFFPVFTVADFHVVCFIDSCGTRTQWIARPPSQLRKGLCTRFHGHQGIPVSWRAEVQKVLLLYGTQ